MCAKSCAQNRFRKESNREALGFKRSEVQWPEYVHSSSSVPLLLAGLQLPTSSNMWRLQGGTSDCDASCCECTWRFGCFL